MTEYNSFIGVDVSRHHLDIHILSTGHQERIANSFEAASALMARHPGAAFACEATGGYERALLHAAHACGQAIWRLHPADVHAFGRLVGQRAKSDPIDACKIARACACVAETRKPTHVRPHSDAVRDLVMLRSHCLDMITLWRGHLTRLSGAARRIATRQLQHALRMKAELTAQIAAAIAAEDTLEEQAKRLTSLPGVGPITAAVLIADMPKLGTLSARQAAALAGVAPHPRQSGSRQKTGRCSGGRSRLRRTLYMAALAAIRAQKDPFAGCYKHLRENGKPHKIAITAVMRKMIVALNQITKEKRNWKPA